MCALVPAKPRHAGQMPISYIVLITHVQHSCVGIRFGEQIGGALRSPVLLGARGGREMEKAAKEVAPEITPAEEIKVSTEQILAEANEEVKEAPSTLRAKLRHLT